MTAANPYICSCTHLRIIHGQGIGRCYHGKGKRWCKCLAYDGPQPCRECKGPHAPKAAHSPH